MCSKHYIAFAGFEGPRKYGFEAYVPSSHEFLWCPAPNNFVKCLQHGKLYIKGLSVTMYYWLQQHLFSYIRERSNNSYEEKERN